MSQATSQSKLAQAERQRAKTMLPAVAGRTSTDETAYQRNLPCLNPNCKSHGQPHPNCRCYGFAEGGEAGHYCSQDRAHMPSCLYYMAEGGDSPQNAELWQPEASQAPQTGSNEAPPNYEDTEEAAPSYEATQEAPPAYEDTHPQTESPYNTPLQKTIGYGEEALRGATGPLANVIEAHPFKTAGALLGMGFTTPDLLGPIPPKDIEGRKGALNSIGAAAARIAGEAAMASTATAEMAGSFAVKQAIQSGLVQGNDEISKALLGQGDPEHPVGAALAHVGSQMLFGFGAGKLFGAFGSAASGKLQALEDAKVAERAPEFLQGLGYASQGITSTEGASATTKAGMNYFDTLVGKAAKRIARIPASVAGFKAGVLFNSLGLGGVEPLNYGSFSAGVAAEEIVNKMLQKPVSKALRYVAPAILKTLGEGSPQAVSNAVNWGIKVGKGAAAMSGAVNSLFDASVQHVTDEPTDKAIQHIKDYVEQGGSDKELESQRQVGPQGYAHGGEVAQQGKPEDPLSSVFPEQNVMLNTAKSRVYNYLNSVRPQSIQSKLPFDSKVSTKHQEKTYDKVVRLSAQPLSILKDIKDGSLTPATVKHFVSMYPEVHTQLAKKLTEGITKAQLADKKPSHKIRQAMSLFMGTALDSNMTPANIQAAQSVFAQKSQMQQAAQQQGKKNKKGTTTLSKMSENYQTNDQAASARQKQ